MIKTPQNQKRLTNVAIIRYAHAGKRFELAAYPSKVVNYRAGVETNLSEVLQSESIFMNVSKGELASASDLMKAFDTDDQVVVAKIILAKGALQQSTLERAHSTTNMTNQLVTMLAVRCVNADTGRVFTESALVGMLKESGFNVNLTKDIKVVFLEAVKLLKAKGCRIERARMRLRVAGNGPFIAEVRSVDDVIVEEVGEGTGTAKGTSFLVFTIPPAGYQAVQGVVKRSGGYGSVDVVKLAVVDDEEREVGAAAPTAAKSVNIAAATASLGKVALTPPPPPAGFEKCETFSGVRAGMEFKTGESGTGYYAASSAASDSVKEKKAPLPPPPVKSKGDSDSSDDEQPMSTKDKKKAARKSKKTARRALEKEEEIKAKVEKERERRSEREERLKGGEAAVAAPVGGGAAGGSKACTTCGGNFTMAAYRAHFKSDWHRYNLKLKGMGVGVVGEEEFREVDSDALFIE